MAIEIKASPGHANGIGAIPAHVKEAGREGAKARVSRQYMGHVSSYQDGRGHSPPLASFYIKLVSKESPWHANGRDAIPVHSKAAGAIPAAGFSLHQFPNRIKHVAC